MPWGAFDEDLLARYQSLIRARRSLRGPLTIVSSSPHAILFRRGSSALVAINAGDDPITFPAANGVEILGWGATVGGGQLVVPPRSAAIVALIGS
jgi:hypothetical protein